MKTVKDKKMICCKILNELNKKKNERKKETEKQLIRKKKQI